MAAGDASWAVRPTGWPGRTTAMAAISDAAFVARRIEPLQFLPAGLAPGDGFALTPTIDAWGAFR